jgi:hypothetical protein
MIMLLRKILPLALIVGGLVAAAPAHASYIVGMGDQNAAIFDQTAYQDLHIKRVRYLVPYDWYKDAGQAAEVDTFMQRSHAAGADVLVHFTARRGCYVDGKYSRSKACKAPSVAAYTRDFKRFKKAYPWVKTYGAWNEANHPSQPTSKNPKLAAQYFLALQKNCKGCKIVAIDVLDVSNLTSYLKSFLKYDKGKAKIFGLHNYGDVNRSRSTGTRSVLSRVRGEVWLTETGGILTFLPSFKTSATRQARSTKYMFSLANTYDTRRKGMKSRISRLYNYQYTGAEEGARFDAGLVNFDGTLRSAYAAFKKGAAKAKR